MYHRMRSKGASWDGSRHRRFHGDTIFNYAAYGIICVENQISLGSGETFMRKNYFSSGYGSRLMYSYSIIIVIIQFLP